MSVTARYVHSARLCVIPHADNNYHPKLLRHKPLAIVSALLVSTKLLALLFVILLPKTAELSTITAARIVQLTNAERVEAGLEPLTVNDKLTSAAQQKGEHMLQEDYFSHISPSGITPWFWMNKVGYTYKVAGENLAIDFTEAEDVVQAWMNSPTHKENMLLSSYTETGVAVVTGEFQGGTSTIVVHMFGLPSTATAQVAPATTVSPTTPTPAIVLPTTTPLPSPSPTVTPTIIPADTTPPEPPVITVITANENVADTAQVSIQAEAGTTLEVLANDTVVQRIAALTDKITVTEITLAEIPDGLVTLTATATDAAGNTSPASAAVTVTKDTTGPRIDEAGLKFMLTIQTDNPQWWMIWSDDNGAIRAIWRSESETYEFTQEERMLIPFRNESLTLSLFDEAGNESVIKTISLAPVYNNETNQDFVATPAKFNRAVRIMTTIIFVIVLILLSLAIIIHIRIQRPALIAHASLVLVLAAVLILW